MKICLISREYSPKIRGGIGTYTYNLAHALTELGHEAHVISMALPNTQKDQRDFMDKKVYIHEIKYRNPFAMIPIVKKFRRSSDTVSYSCYASKRIHQLVKDHGIEVVHAAEYGAETFLFSLVKIRPLVIRFATPTYIVLALDKYWKKSQFKLLDVTLETLLEMVPAKMADALISPSHFLVNPIRKLFGIDPSKVHIIPNGIDINLFRPNTAHDLRDSLKLNGIPIVLFVGRLEMVKGAHILLDAIPDVLESYPKTVFFFVGKDSKSSPEGGYFRDYILNRASQRGFTNNIRLIGRVDWTEMPKYYALCDVFVIPSLHESFGYTCLEAMSCGKPCIGSLNTGTQEIIDHGINGLLVPRGNSQKLSEAIIELLNDSTLRAKMGKNARRKAETVFSIKNTALQMLKVYKKVLIG